MKKSKRKKQAANLRAALTDVQGLGKGRSIQKDTAIIFRVSAEEKAEIRDVAERLGLSVSGYLLELHRIARERIVP